MLARLMIPFRTFMPIALEEARLAYACGEVPVGAVIVDAQGMVISRARNSCRADRDATAHAEITAIRAASATLGREKLDDCDLYVTLEPCAMCAGAIVAARLRRVYFGAFDPKSGGVVQGARVFDHPQAHYKPEWCGGLEEAASAELLERFFQTRR